MRKQGEGCSLPHGACFTTAAPPPAGTRAHAHPALTAHRRCLPHPLACRHSRRRMFTCAVAPALGALLRFRYKQRELNQLRRTASSRLKQARQPPASFVEAQKKKRQRGKASGGDGRVSPILPGDVVGATDGAAAARVRAAKRKTPRMRRHYSDGERAERAAAAQARAANSGRRNSSDTHTRRAARRRRPGGDDVGDGSVGDGGVGGDGDVGSGGGGDGADVGGGGGAGGGGRHRRGRRHRHRKVPFRNGFGFVAPTPVVHPLVHRRSSSAGSQLGSTGGSGLGDTAAPGAEGPARPFRLIESPAMGCRPDLTRLAQVPSGEQQKDFGKRYEAALPRVAPARGPTAMYFPRKGVKSPRPAPDATAPPAPAQLDVPPHVTTTPRRRSLSPTQAPTQAAWTSPIDVHVKQPSQRRAGEGLAAGAAAGEAGRGKHPRPPAKGFRVQPRAARARRGRKASSGAASGAATGAAAASVEGSNGGAVVGGTDAASGRGAASGGAGETAAARYDDTAANAAAKAARRRAAKRSGRRGGPKRTPRSSDGDSTASPAHARVAGDASAGRPVQRSPVAAAGGGGSPTKAESSPPSAKKGRRRTRESRSLRTTPRQANGGPKGQSPERRRKSAATRSAGRVSSPIDTSVPTKPMLTVATGATATSGSGSGGGAAGAGGATAAPPSLAQLRRQLNNLDRQASVQSIKIDKALSDSPKPLAQSPVGVGGSKRSGWRARDDPPDPVRESGSTDGAGGDAQVAPAPSPTAPTTPARKQALMQASEASLSAIRRTLEAAQLLAQHMEAAQRMLELGEPGAEALASRVDGEVRRLEVRSCVCALLPCAWARGSRWCMCGASSHDSLPCRRGLGSV